MRLALVVQEAVRPQRLFEAALEELAERDHQLLLCVTGAPGPLLTCAEHWGAETAALSCAGPARVPLAARRLRPLLRRWRPDVVHAHEPLPAIAAAIAVAPRRFPVVYHRHHLRGSRKLGLASRLATALTDRTFGVSDAVVLQLQREQPRASSRVVLARNGAAPIAPVTAEARAALRTELGLADDDLVLVAVARLRREKGLEHLIAARPLVSRRSGRRARLVLVGTGPDEARLRAAAEGDDDVTFAGHRDDVAPWFDLADVIVIPSLHEALPLAALEALSSGTPIVASAVGGLPEVVVDGLTGRLVPPGDPEALADALVDVCRSEAARSAMGESARTSYLERFSVGSMVDGWERGYRQLTSSRHG